MRTRNMAYIALMAVVICVCSWISIPMAVPFTMQTFGVFCALLLLGGRRGAIAILLYVFMGAVGLPVFSGFRSGVAALAGPTGGYILGFILCGGLYWLLEKRAKAWLLLAAGNVVCYIFGTAWFVYVYTASGKPITFGAALLACVAPYVAPDAAKLALALLVSKRLSPHIKA